MSAGTRIRAEENSQWIFLLLAAISILAVFAAGAVAHADTDQETRAGWHRVRILGYKTGPQGISFQVPTGGCLQKNDFVVRVVQEGGGPRQLQLLSDKVDNCRGAYPYGKMILFSYEEAGVEIGDSFVVTNSSGTVNRAGYAEIFLPAGG